MLIFTSKARQVIGSAVFEFGSGSDQAVWQNWLAAHPAIRNGPDEPWDDGFGPMPDPLRHMLLRVLDQMVESIWRQLKPAGSEDELADLGNDLSYIKFLHKTVREPPAAAA